MTRPLHEPIYEEPMLPEDKRCYHCGADLDGTWEEDEEEYEVEPGRFKTMIVMVCTCQGCGRINRA